LNQKDIQSTENGKEKNKEKIKVMAMTIKEGMITGKEIEKISNSTNKIDL
jgi:hypothetical protein